MERKYDVAIIGSGGAGLTAAIYSSRARLGTVLFEKLMSGGQIALTDIVENYPGFPEGITGAEISKRMEDQAKRYGTTLVYEEVKSLVPRGKDFEIVTANATYKSRALIFTAGASFRTLGVSGEKELTGRGVSYCATCDGAFFKDKDVIVVGGGDSALQEGLFLTRFVTRLSIVHRRDQLRAGPLLQQRAKQNPKIHYIWDTVVEKIYGDKKVEGVNLRNVKTGKVQDFKTDGVFVFIGHEPNSALLKGLVNLDEKGYVKTDPFLRTSVPGIFAAGEIRAGATRQLVAACGEGCEAAMAAQAYLDALK
ncbi:MAG: thioredoxin-disulfide reductase [Candidatus Omnitrophica bacterium]|nr:thioredoxin-disulfide reductase [Candidatus Omnitrophota bacterium]